MSKYKYYIFEYHTKKLACFDLLEEASESDFISVINLSTLDIYFDGHSFEKFDEFLRYISYLNEKTAHEYEANFKIKPPYTVYQAFRDLICYTFFKSKGELLCFTPRTVPSGRANISPIYDFLQSMMDHLFNMEYMIKLHNFLYNSMVIRPLYESRNYQFMITYADGKTTTAIIWRNACTTRYYFCAPSMANDEIFDSYSIPKSEISEIIKDAGFEWHGRWPETDMQTVYKVIDYINQHYYAFCSSVDGNFVVSDSSISYCGIIFKIKQHKNGKWYIDGDITKIISMFKMPDITELRKFIDKTLGRKFRRGLFPECDSKEEIIKLLNEIKKCPT